MYLAFGEGDMLRHLLVTLVDYPIIVWRGTGNYSKRVCDRLNDVGLGFDSRYGPRLFSTSQTSIPVLGPHKILSIRYRLPFASS
jgi:hypothetical protein